MNIKKILLLLFIGFSTLSFGQPPNPVTWKTSKKHIKGDLFELQFKADIDDGWNIYSAFMEAGGPVPTSFEFEAGDHFEIIGDLKESGTIKKGYDKLFDQEVVKVFGQAIYTQQVSIKDYDIPLAGYLEFMVCDDEKCLPPSPIDFSFSFTKPNKKAPEKKTSNKKKTDLNPDQETIAASQQNIPSVSEIESDGANDFQFDPISSTPPSPVTWNYEVVSKANQQYEIILEAMIPDEYVIYSKDVEEGGPVPTTLTWENEGDGYALEGELKESADKIEDEFDKIFEMNVKKLKHRAKYVQGIKVERSDAIAKLYLEYMVCDEEKCFIFDDDFEITFEGGEVLLQQSTEIPPNAITINQRKASLTETYSTPLGECGDEKSKDNSLLWIFIFSFLGGLIALLTPCVFPMIPLTVSFFTKGSTDRKSGVRNGILYGISIIFIYVVIGLLITLIAGPNALNALSTHWLSNSLFFLIFVVFAFSFFGFFEITLPSSLANRSDTLAEKGGLIGIFFMAFTLAIVSFSCTGPIIGSAIVEAATRSQVGPAISMLGFSLALALPFGLFAAFPAWLNSLPKSGSWMNSVKVVLGFLELALALKFLSVADMTSKWGFLRYELFMGLWVIIFAAIALYLLGFIKFPHDSPVKKLSPTRWVFALGSIVLTLYLASGFFPDKRTQTYHALPLMSGLAPPAHYNFFKPLPPPDVAIQSRFPSYSKCANNLDCFKDYEEGVTYAKEVNKPIMLDFTGHGCVNCRKTEEHIWINDQVWRKLKDDYVLISLYTDENVSLDEPIYSEITGEKIRKVGEMWKDFQQVNFEQISQPLYVLMTPDEKVMAQPRGYKEGVRDYNNFLECGLETYARYSKDNNLLGAR